MAIRNAPSGVVALSVMVLECMNRRQVAQTNGSRIPVAWLVHTPTIGRVATWACNPMQRTIVPKIHGHGRTIGLRSPISIRTVENTEKKTPLNVTCTAHPTLGSRRIRTRAEGAPQTASTKPLYVVAVEQNHLAGRVHREEPEIRGVCLKCRSRMGHAARMHAPFNEHTTRPEIL